MSIAQSWRAIAAAVPSTRPPASEADVDRIEEVIGAALPDDVRESLLLHDGVPEGDMFDALGDDNPEDVYEVPMGCDRIIAEWEALAGLRDGGDIDDDMWLPRFVPLADGGAGDFIAVDVETGRLRYLDSEVGHEESAWPTWSEYLAAAARAVGSGPRVR
ncbi:SMI1/KNR4 family protein [Corynebacterium sp. 335C]